MKVVLSGEGADELFGGYSYFNTAARIEQSRKWLNAVPNPIFTAILKARQLTHGPSMLRKMSDVIKDAKIEHYNFYPYIRKVWLEEDLKRICNEPFYDGTLNQFPSVRGVVADNNISAVSFSEMKYYMQNVLLRDTDQMSMAQGLEVRVPFLAHDLVEFTLGLGDAAKRGKYGKQLLIDSFPDLLPKEIYDRPKMGFTLPWEQWLRKELGTYCETRILMLSQHDLFEQNKLMELWDNFKKGDNHISWSRWWLLIVLENWLSANQVEIV